VGEACVPCATKYGDLKINNNFILRKLRVTAETRNFNTVSRLAFGRHDVIYLNRYPDGLLRYPGMNVRKLKKMQGGLRWL